MKWRSNTSTVPLNWTAISFQAYVNRAEVELKFKQPEKAVADLKRAIELDPAGEDPAANRARMMALALNQALQGKKFRKLNSRTREDYLHI
jgi:Tfp pilus assembly protein PilF